MFGFDVPQPLRPPLWSHLPCCRAVALEAEHKSKPCGPDWCQWRLALQFHNKNRKNLILGKWLLPEIVCYIKNEKEREKKHLLWCEWKSRSSFSCCCEAVIHYEVLSADMLILMVRVFNCSSAFCGVSHTKLCRKTNRRVYNGPAAHAFALFI